MKRFLLHIVFISVAFSVTAQREHDLNTASLYSIVTAADIEKLKSHPDFGMVKLTDSTGAETKFTELVDKRDKYSTLFSIPGTDKFSKRQSAEPIHYQDENGFWRNMDNALTASSTNPNAYELNKQEHPISFNFKTGETFLSMAGKEGITIGKNLKAKQVDANGTTLSEEGNANSVCNINKNKSLFKNYFNKIDFLHSFDYWGVKTSFVINDKSAINPNAEYLIFEEELVLPENWKLKSGKPDEKQISELHIIDDKGIIAGKFLKPVYYDDYRPKVDTLKRNNLKKFIDGSYSIINDKGTYKIQLIVNAKWLLDSATVYPVTIDPNVVNDDYTQPLYADNNSYYCSYNLDVNLGSAANVYDTYLHWDITGYYDGQYTEVSSVGGVMGPYLNPYYYDCAYYGYNCYAYWGTYSYAGWTPIGNGFTTGIRTYTYSGMDYTYGYYYCVYTGTNYFTRRYADVYFTIPTPPCSWSGSSGYDWPTVPCAPTFVSMPVGSGSYTHFTAVAGATYTVSTCGSTFDTDLTIYHANPAWTLVGWNQGNGPDCGGTSASYTFTSTFSGAHLAVVNRVGCQQHDWTGQSAVLKIRQDSGPGCSCSPNQPATTWTGAVNSNWNNQSNWTNCVPGPNTNTVVPVVGTGNYPVLNGGAAYVNTITVNVGATVTVNAPATLTATQ